MTISFNSIKKYTTLPNMPLADLAWKITEASCEIEKIKSSSDYLKQFFCVEVSAIKKHPEADSLNLVSFNHKGQILEVVCGAPNVAIGLKVPYAPLGTTLPNGIKLEEKKIRGIVSRGMLCSEDELGLSNNHDGLLVLDNSFKVGDSLENLLPNSDTLLEIDNKSITNRSDLWGFYGLSREFSALFNTPFIAKFNEEYKTNFQNQTFTGISPLKVELNDSAVKGFYLLTIQNVSTKPSPDWLKKELEVLGVRSINALVDISNYVMLELGIPNHFYNLASISGDKLIVKRANDGDKFMTLDGKERLLKASDTIICDSEKTLGLAGIMGGETSMISDDTTSIAVEVAIWRAEEIRKTSIRVGLRTDASIRYEKSLDTEMLITALARISELIKDIFPDSKIIGKLEGANLAPFKPYSVNFNIDRFNSVMGLNLTIATASKILNSIDFKTKTKDATNLTVYVPSFRSTKDVMGECDIFEEVGRINGYSNITMQSPKWDLEVAKLPNRVAFERKIQDFCVLNGQMMEVFTHPMTGPDALKLAKWNIIGEPLIVANSVSPDKIQMRPSLIPSFLELAELNQKHTDRFTCFEYGRAFLSDNKNFSSDRYCLAIAFFDRTNSRFLEAFNFVENLLSYLNLGFKIDFGAYRTHLHSNDWAGLHPKECATISLEWSNCGIINTVHPYFMKNYKMKGHLTLVEIDFTYFIDNYNEQKINYKPLSKYPFSNFDCTVLLSQNEEASKIITLLKHAGIDFLEETKIVDIFTMADKNRAITIRNRLHDKDKTLSSEELKTSEGLIINTLLNGGYALK